jgi:hypothetical protein
VEMIRRGRKSLEKPKGMKGKINVNIIERLEKITDKTIN